MNLLKNKLAAKLMLVAMMLFSSGAIFAANKISLGTPTVNTANQIEVPVLFDCDDEAVAFQFTVVTPQGLKIDQVIENASRLSANHSASFSEKGNSFMVFSYPETSFLGTSGVVATIYVEASSELLKTPEKIALSLKDINISGRNGKKLVENATATLDVVDVAITAKESMVVKPGSVANIEVGLKNSFEVAGLELNIVLPEGFTFHTNADGTFVPEKFSDRLPYSSTRVSGTPKGNSVKIIVFDMSGKAAVRGTSGNIFSFNVDVPATIAAGSVIKIENVIASTIAGVDNDGVGAEISIVDGSVTYNKAMAEVETLKSSLAAALTKIAEDCPDVKDNFKGEAVTEEISKLVAAINAANDANVLTVDYDKVLAPKADITAAIAKLVEDAKAAQAKVDADKALKAAAEKAAAEIKALNDKLAAALESIAKNCPLVADDFKGENVADAIKALQAKVDAAVADGSLTEKYDEVMANTIGELIDTLVKEAEIAQAAAVEAEAAEKARKENNEKAYKEDLAAIDELTAKLQAEIKALEDHFNAIGETEPNWVLVEQTNILVKIRDLKTKADNENDRVAKEGDYRKQVDALDTMLVNQLIAAYVANVKTSGIDSIISDENLGNVRIYTIDGVQHNTLVPGVNIIVKEDGTTTKVYVK